MVSFGDVDAQCSRQDNSIKKAIHRACERYYRSEQSLQSILQQQYVQRQERMNAASRTAGVTAERLKSFCGYNYGDTASGILFGGKTDSALYTYSGQYGSVFNFQRMDYAPPSFATSTSPISAGDNRKPYNLQPELFPDSVYTWNSYCPIGVVVTDTFGPADIVDNYYSGFSFTENGNQNFPTVGGEITRTNYYYDGTGKLVFLLYFAYDGSLSTWDTTNSMNLYYNGSGQMIMDSSSVNYGAGLWGEDNKQLLTYDGSGNVSFIAQFTDSLGSWIPDIDHFLYYNADNTLQADSVSQYNVGLWTPYLRDSFGYTSGLPYFTYSMSEQFVGDSIYSRVTKSKHVAVSGLPDTVYNRAYYQYPYPGPLTLFSAKKVSFSYDSYNNPVVANSYNYSITDTATGAGFYVSAPSRAFYYYYETYEASAVTNLPNVSEQISIFPNPASDQVTISRPDAVKGAYTLIKLTNAVGQTVMTEGMPWMNISETISLSGLAPGVYVLTMQDKKGNALTTRKLVKQ